MSSTLTRDPNESTAQWLLRLIDEEEASDEEIGEALAGADIQALDLVHAAASEARRRNEDLTTGPMISLTPADKLKGCREEEYEDLSKERKKEVCKNRGDVLPVMPQNILRVLQYEGTMHPEAGAQVEYVNRRRDVVEESREEVLEIVNRSRRRLEHRLKGIQ